jgi:hypothetical protein
MSSLQSEGVPVLGPGGTIFENTKIPLNKWFRAIHLMLTSRGVTIVEARWTNCASAAPTNRQKLHQPFTASQAIRNRHRQAPYERR